MKRIFFLISLVFLMFMIPLSANSTNSTDSLDKSIINGVHKYVDKVGNTYYYRNNDDIGNPVTGGYGKFGNFYKNGELWEYDIEGKHIKETVHFITLDKAYKTLPAKSILFCIEPLKLAEWIDDDNPNNSNFESLSKVQQENISKITSLVISRYSQTGNYDYLAAGQLLVWKEVGAKNIKYPSSISKEYNEISNLIKTYDVVPSFLKDDLTLTYNDVYGIYDLYLKDSNNVLDNKYKKSLIGTYGNYHIEDGKDKNDLYVWTDKIDSSSNIEAIYNPLPKSSSYLEDVYYMTKPTFINSGQDLVTGLSMPIKINMSFKVNPAKGKVKLKKQGCYKDKCEDLAGVSFGLYTIDGDLLKEKKTDENGNLEFDSLSIGRYYIQELSTLEDYNVSNKKYEFSIIKDDDVALINGGNPIINYKKTEDVKIIKKDYNNNLLKGAEFVYYKDLNNNQILDKEEEETISDVYTTAEDGSIYLKDLEYGSYLLKEIKAPIGYEIEEDFYPFKLDGSLKVLLIEVLNSKVEEKIISKGKLKIVKKDYDNNLLKGAEFVYYKDLNNNKILDEEEEETISDIYTTDDKGVAMVNNLDFGNYLLKEVKAPKGYYKKGDFYPFSISEDLKTYKIEVYNKKMPKALVKTGKENKIIDWILKLFNE